MSTTGPEPASPNRYAAMASYGIEGIHLTDVACRFNVLPYQGLLRRFPPENRALVVVKADPRRLNGYPHAV
jgi:hypothetical protein